MKKPLGFLTGKNAILSAVCLSMYMCTLDASIVNIALPRIMSYFNSSLATTEWVVMIYLLLISSLLLTYGRLGDMYGHKPVFLTGLAVFTFASALNAVAPSVGFLIAARGIQAIGAGMVMAVMQAIVAQTFNPAERGRAIGITLAVVSLGLATGPTLGGILVSKFDWQSIFSVNIPVGIIGTLWAAKVLPFKKGNSQKFDIAGSVLVFSWLSCLLLALSHGQEWGWASGLVIILIGVSAILFTAFILVEKKSAFPMLNLAMFRNRLFSTANTAALINYMTQYTVTFVMPFYLMNRAGLSAINAGYSMSAFPVFMMLASPFAGSLSDKIGSRLLTAAGMGIIALGITILYFVAIYFEWWAVILGLSLIGLGTGLFQSPNNNAIMNSVKKDHLGVASGMIASMRNVGQVLGVAVCGAVLSSRLAAYAALQANAFSFAVRDTYAVAACFALLGAIISLARGDTSKPVV